MSGFRHIVVVNAFLSILSWPAAFAADAPPPAAQQPLQPEVPPEFWELRAARSMFREGYDKLHAGQVADAVALFERGLRLDSKNALALFYLGDGYIKQNRLEDALKAVNRGLELRPNDPVGLFFLGEVHSKVGHIGDARRSYQLSLKSDRNSQVASKVVAALGDLKSEVSPPKAPALGGRIYEGTFCDVFDGTPIVAINDSRLTFLKSGQKVILGKCDAKDGCIYDEKEPSFSQVILGPGLVPMVNRTLADGQLFVQTFKKVDRGATASSWAILVRCMGAPSRELASGSEKITLGAPSTVTASATDSIARTLDGRWCLAEKSRGKTWVEFNGDTAIQSFETTSGDAKQYTRQLSKNSDGTMFFEATNLVGTQYRITYTLMPDGSMRDYTLSDRTTISSDYKGAYSTWRRCEAPTLVPAKKSQAKSSGTSIKSSDNSPSSASAAPRRTAQAPANSISVNLADVAKWIAREDNARREFAQNRGTQFVPFGSQDPNEVVRKFNLTEILEEFPKIEVCSACPHRVNFALFCRRGLSTNIAGKRVRMWSDPFVQEFFRRLQVVPVLLPLVETQSAIRTGIIDCVAFPQVVRMQ